MAAVIYIFCGIALAILFCFGLLKIAERQVDRVINQAFEGFDHYDNLKG